MKPAIVALLLLFSAGIASAQQIWCVGESTKIKPGDEPSPANLTWNGQSKTVSLESARNEYVAFQIGVRADLGDLKHVTVESADLAGPGGEVIPRANIDLFVEHYMDVKISSRGDNKHLDPECTAGEHPTQMVPFDAKKFGAPFDVGAKRSQPVWVDIYVPEDAKAGAYSGKFTVKAGDTVLSEINISLDVWNFALPNETHFKTYLYAGPEKIRWAHHLTGDETNPEFITIEDRYFQMAHQHRLNFHPIGGDSVVDAFGPLFKYYDGSGFTERVGKGVGQNVMAFQPEGLNDEKGLKDWAKKVVDQFDGKFAPDSPHLSPPPLIFAYVWDEPHTPDDFATSKQHCKWIHEAVGKQLKTFIATGAYEKYDPGDVDIFSEPLAQDVPKIFARGDSVWDVNSFYTSGPYVDSPGYGGRSIPWMSWKMNLPGWQFWDVCYWVDSENTLHKVGKRWVHDFAYKDVNADPQKYLLPVWTDPLNFDESRKQGYPVDDSIRQNGDGILFYPGYDVGVAGPIASYAMKSLRRGMQDYEYLWLLKQQPGGEAQIQPIIDSVCPQPGKWSSDPESWDKARLALAKLLNKP